VKKRKSGLFVLLTYLAIAFVVLSVVSFGVLFIASGNYKPPEHLRPWKHRFAKKFLDPRLKVISTGILAQSLHNLQPWKIYIDKQAPNDFTLFVDTERHAEYIDPLFRGSTQNQGMFLEYVRIAANWFEKDAGIKLFPQGEYTRNASIANIKTVPIAFISLGRKGVSDTGLYPAIYGTFNSQTPYEDQPLSEKELNLLQKMNSDPNLQLMILQDFEQVEPLRNFVQRGIEIELGLERALKGKHSLWRTNEHQKLKYKDGLSVESYGLTEIEKFFFQSLGTLFPMDLEGFQTYLTEQAAERIRATPVFAIILSGRDSRTSQVKAGMLFSRFRLAARVLDLNMELVNQPIRDYPEMRDLSKEVHDAFSREGQRIQMIIRVGRSIRKVSPTSRRNVLKLLVK